MKAENNLNQELTLEEFLKAREITPDECAADTGIRTSTLYGFWKGQKPPSYKNQKILTKYTGGLVKW